MLQQSSFHFDIVLRYLYTLVFTHLMKQLCIVSTYINLIHLIFSSYCCLPDTKFKVTCILWTQAAGDDVFISTVQNRVTSFALMLCIKRPTIVPKPSLTSL